jgi:DnaJ-class molecular chaperone
MNRITGPKLPHWTVAKSGTHYEVMGVAKSASRHEIDIAFLKLSLLCHPGICRQPNAEAVFARAAEAHRVLSDEVRRFSYDLTLSPAVRTPASHPAVAVYQKTAWNLHGSGTRISLKI